MPAEWVEQSGVFTLGAPLHVVDLHSRLAAMVDGRRIEHPSRGVLDVLEGHAEGILQNYLLQHGIVFSVPNGGWRIVLRAPRKAALSTIFIFVKDPKGVVRTLLEFEETIARWCCERAASR
jgi:hypothetical protein